MMEGEAVPSQGVLQVFFFKLRKWNIWRGSPRGRVCGHPLTWPRWSEGGLRKLRDWGGAQGVELNINVNIEILRSKGRDLRGRGKEGPGPRTELKKEERMPEPPPHELGGKF